MIRPNLRNFGRAVGRAVRAALHLKPVLAPAQIVNYRLDVCYKCPRIDDDFEQCTLCTCFIIAKTALATESCPDKPSRWGVWDGKRSGRPR